MKYLIVVLLTMFSFNVRASNDTIPPKPKKEDKKKFYKNDKLTPILFTLFIYVSYKLFVKPKEE
jgi:hypothetical protein